MKTRYTLLATGIALSMLAGCATNKEKEKPTSVVITKQENLKTEANVARQVDPASKLAGTVNKIKVVDIRTTTVNERMYITIELKNDRGLRDVINYRLRWLDANGLMAAQYDPWQTIALEGFEQKTIALTAPTPKATDFRIEIQSNN
jgi:uncharacterized protein YcfL